MTIDSLIPIASLFSMVVGLGIIWGKSKQSVEDMERSQSRDRAATGLRVSKLEDGLSQMMKELHEQRIEDLKREIIANKALDVKLETLKTSVSHDIGLAVKRIDEMMAALISKSKQND